MTHRQLQHHKPSCKGQLPRRSRNHLRCLEEVQSNWVIWERHFQPVVLCQAVHGDPGSQLLWALIYTGVDFAWGLYWFHTIINSKDCKQETLQVWDCNMRAASYTTREPGRLTRLRPLSWRGRSASWWKKVAQGILHHILIPGLLLS